MLVTDDLALQKPGDEEEAEITAEFANMTIDSKIQALTKKLQNITEELHQQVRDKHGALLQQAMHASRFDAALSSLASDVERIRNNGQRLKQQVDNQFVTVENQTKVLARLHELSHLLRSAGTMLTLSGKLRNTKDVLRQAEIHYELGALIEDEELKNIDFIDSELNFVIKSRQKIKNLSQMQLVTGLQERNDSLVINALKIFINFNILENSLDNLVATHIANLEQALKECFAGNDISNNVIKDNKKSVAKVTTRGPGKTPQLTTTQNYRAKFWKSLHCLFYEELYESCEQIRLLRAALQQINQYAFAAVDNEQAVYKRFWQEVQQLLRKSFTDCPAHVMQTLQEGLAKLLSSVRSLEKRLNGEFLFDNELFAGLESGYISKCAANMKACLAGIDMPNLDTVDSFVRVVAIELSAALIDDKLTNAVAAVFMSCGKDFCNKLESQIKLGADAKQVVDLPNFQQTQNTLLANILYYYKISVERMLADLNDQFSNSASSQAGISTAQKDIIKSLEHVSLLINRILQQIMESINTTINIIMLSMHREPGLNSEHISANGPSMYMKELKDFIARVWANHVQVFDDKQNIEKCGQELAKRCVEQFVHNLSIVRPISAAGRQRLKSDCGFLEQALRPIDPKFSELGNLARLLRAMSHLIVQQPNELVEHANIGADALIPSYIILLLLFGHASSDMQSPHTAANWSNERLLVWLESHTEEHEKLELISGALQRYRDIVRRKKIEHYDQVFPLMVNFYEQAIKATENL